MRHNIWMILAVLLCLFLQAGCGTKETIYIEASGEDTEFSIEEAELTEQYDTETEAAVEDTSAETAETGEAAYCYVHVCGAVCEPGVYALVPGSRVYEAVALAGGLAEDASEAAVNQAEPLTDGQMLYIPTEEEVAAQGMKQCPNGSGASADGANASAAEAEASDGRLDLNTATVEELMTLSGIGQTKAEDILAYRKEHGGFSAPEEIMRIDGIKEGLYNRIKDDIKVKN